MSESTFIVISAISGITYSIFTTPSCASISCKLAKSGLAVRIFSIVGWLASLSFEVYFKRVSGWQRYISVFTLPLFMATILTSIPEAIPIIEQNKRICGHWCPIHDVTAGLWVLSEIAVIFLRIPASSLVSYFVAISTVFPLFILNIVRNASPLLYDESSIISICFGYFEYMCLIIIRTIAAESLVRQTFF